MRESGSIWYEATIGGKRGYEEAEAQVDFLFVCVRKREREGTAIDEKG